MHKRHIVVMGGGTGTYTVLSGLKKYIPDLSAIVAMSDSGGSTGRLRDELGVLPPGDVRQCLVALSADDALMRKLINYRFENGGLHGHSFGNLLLSALEKITGSFDVAVEKAASILRVEGRVIPATLDNVELVAELANRTIHGEAAIHESDLSTLRVLKLAPRARVNPKAVKAIMEADAVVIGPGDIFSSVFPVLLPKGIADALQKTKAKKVYVCNLMTRKGHTEGWGVEEFTSRIESYIGTSLDSVLYNRGRMPPRLFKKYADEGSALVSKPRVTDKRYVGAPLIARDPIRQVKGDLHKRNYIRHDSDRLARAIMEHI